MTGGMRSTLRTPLSPGRTNHHATLENLLVLAVFLTVVLGALGLAVYLLWVNL